MPMTPDRRPGALIEDSEIILRTNATGPSTPGAFNYDGTSYVFRDAVGTFNPRSSSSAFTVSGSFIKTVYSSSFGDVYASQIGSDVYFYVSGTRGPASDPRRSVFGSDAIFSGSIKVAEGLSGSHTALFDGTPAFLGGTGILVITSSNGSVVFSADNSVVATLTGSTFSGPASFVGGLSGSLTRLTDGSSYIVAGGNVLVTSNSSGQVSISTVNSGTIHGITAGIGLTGGGNSGNVTISLSSTGSAGTYGSASQVPVFSTDAQGRVSEVVNTSIQVSESQVTNLTFDLASRVLTTTSVTAGTGLSGGGSLTASRTLSLSNTGSAGTYGSSTQVPVFDTDAQGRVTAVTNTSIQINESQVTNLTSDLSNRALTSTTVTAGTGLSGGGSLAASMTISLSNTGSAGTYGSSTQVPVFDTDTQGRVTAVTNTSIQIAESQVTNLTTDLSNRALTSTTVGTGVGLTGGGDLTSNRTISLSNTGSAGTYGSASQVPVFSSDAQGRVTSVSNTPIQIDQTQVNNLTADLSNRVLSSRSITAGAGLSGGGDLTADRTLSLSNTGSAGTYGSSTQVPVFSTDAQGRVTAVSNTSIQITESQVTNLTTDLSNKALSSTTISAGTGLQGGGDLSTNRTISLSNTGSAGTYGSSTQVPVFSTDAQGRVTSVTNTAVDLSSRVPTTRTITTSTGIKGGGDLSVDRTLLIDDSIVATVSGTTFTGAVKFSGGVSGSLTTLTNGKPFVVAGPNITINTGSSGEIQITGSAGGSSALPGGLSTHVQFNDGGTSFGGNSSFTFDKINSTLSVPIITSSIGIQVNNITVLGTASISHLETLNQQSLSIGDKYITILCGSIDHSSLDGAGLLYGSGSTGPSVDAQGANAHILYRSSLDVLEIFPNLSITGSLFVTEHAEITGSLYARHLSGSLTRLIDGSSYIVANGNMTVTTSSSGQILLSTINSGTVNTVTAGTGLTGGGTGSTLTLSLSNTGSAGTYGSSTQVPVFSTDAQGRVTAVTNTAVDLSSRVPTSRNVIAGTGLSGGGSLISDITLSLSNTGSAGTYGSSTQVPVFSTDAQGRVTYVANTSIQIPESQVTNLTTDLSNRALSSTTITAGTGLTGGGDLTTNRTLSLSNTGSAGTYGSSAQVPVFSTDAQGRVTAVTNTSIQVSETQVTNLVTDLGNRALTATTITAGTGLTGGGDLSTNRTITLSNTGSAGTYGSSTQVPVFSTDAQGRVTAVSNTSIQIAESQVTSLVTDLSNRALTTTTISAGTGLTGGGSIASNRTLGINDSVVATLTVSVFSGVSKFNSGLSGSLTRLTDGSSYIIAGTGIQITTGSSGAVTVASLASTSGSSWSTANVFGSNNQVITADGLGGIVPESNLSFNPTLNRLEVTGSLYVSSVLVNGSGSSASGVYSHAEGQSTFALGSGSHAEGLETSASGDYSHAEGYLSIASGMFSHAEGAENLVSGDPSTASGYASHAEGLGSQATGTASHAEGSSTSSGYTSHAEGMGTIASGIGSHSEGNLTQASGYGSHAEGFSTNSIASGSHAEGYYTRAVGDYSHSQGNNTVASGTYSFSAGIYTISSGSGQTVLGKYNSRNNASSLFVVGAGTADSDSSRRDAMRIEQGASVGYDRTEITGSLSVGDTNAKAVGSYSIAHGNSRALANYSRAMGQGSEAIAAATYSIAEGYGTVTSGSWAHSEGYQTIARGSASHSEGQASVSIGNYSHAEGQATTATGGSSHSEGASTNSVGEGSHAEGYYTISTGFISHAEGWGANSVGSYSHSEGYYTYSRGEVSHAEGVGAETAAEARGAHASGHYVIASGSNIGQNVVGKYNKKLNDFSLFVVGNGTGTSDGTRSDILRVNNSNVEITGSFVVTGSSISLVSNNTTVTGDMTVAGGVTVTGGVAGIDYGMLYAMTNFNYMM